MKIIADPQIPQVEAAFAPLGDVIFCDGRKITPGNIKDADLLLVRSVTAVNAKLLNDSRVRFVATATSGIDHIDTDYLAEAGIGFAHAAGSNADSVVEYVLSSMLVLSTQFGFRLQDKTVGIIGYGEVGSRLARALEILEVPCLINDPPLQDKTGDERFVSINEILKADLITLHVPLTDTGLYPTRELINRDFLQQMKPQSILINTSRGEVLSEQALQAHREKQTCPVVLDVWQQEPNINRDLLATVDIGTSHIAGYSYDAKIRATEMIREAAFNYFTVNRDAVTATAIADLGQQVIRLADDIDFYYGLELAILSHYDVRSDAAALRRVLELDALKTGAYFDGLRKNYPVRREFSATTIIMSGRNTKLVDKLQQLGFSVRTD